MQTMANEFNYIMNIRHNCAEGNENIKGTELSNFWKIMFSLKTVRLETKKVYANTVVSKILLNIIHINNSETAPMWILQLNK